MAPLRRTYERELKLAIPAGFELPELPGEPLAPRTFTSTYFDTSDRALARAGGEQTHLAADRLIERERTRRREARVAFPEAWAKLEKAGRAA